MAIRCLDLFCGAGGSSAGAAAAGVSIAGGIDVWERAVQTFRLNFPQAQTWASRLEELDPRKVAAVLGRIDLVLASPECTNHTFAKGNRRKGDGPERSRQTAFQVPRFVAALRPRWFVVENVVSMRRWDAYQSWREDLAELGYQVSEEVLDAQEFGVAHSRRRLFVLGDSTRCPNGPIQGRRRQVNLAEVLASGPNNGEIGYAVTPIRGARRRSRDTLNRIERDIRKPSATGAAGEWQLPEPIIRRRSRSF